MTTIPDLPNPVPPTQAELLKHLRAIHQMVAGFAYDRPQERRKLNLNASVSDRFLELVAVAIEASSALANALDFKPADLRAAIAFTQTFLPIVDELMLLARSLSFTIADTRATAGKRALHAYTLSKTLNRPADRELLVPQIAAMKSALGKRGRKKVQPPLAEVPVIEVTAKK